MLFAVLLAVGTAPRAEEKQPTPATRPAFDWSGVWAVFDDGLDLVNLAIARDGTVSTTRLPPGASGPEFGRWEATDDALFIRYVSGRGETIIRHTSGFRHVARREDPTSGERSTRVGSAFRISSPTVPYVGAWRVGGEPTVLVLRSDGTGDRLSEPRASGEWRVADGGAGIRWQDGSLERFDPSAPGVRRVAPKPNVASTPKE